MIFLLDSDRVRFFLNSTTNIPAFCPHRRNQKSGKNGGNRRGRNVIIASGASAKTFVDQFLNVLEF